METPRPSTPQPPNPAPQSLLRRFLLPALILAGIILAAWTGSEWWGRTFEWIRQSGTAGMGVFLAAMVALTSFCFPVSAFGFSAGLLYGPWVGLLLMVVGGYASGTVMFFLGRFALRGTIQSWIHRNPRLRAFERLSAHKAVRINLLARLSPINYGVVCYTLAAGRSNFRQYLLGLVAILPSMGTQVWVGHLAASAGDSLRSGQGAGPPGMGPSGPGIAFLRGPDLAGGTPGAPGLGGGSHGGRCRGGEPRP